MTPQEFQAALLALDSANTLIGFITRQIERARERGELTPEQERQVDAKLDETTSRPHWKKN